MFHQYTPNYAIWIETNRQIRKLFLDEPYMQSNFSFVVVKVDDKDMRLKWESMLISTVATCEECGPSATWLGQHSPKAKIREKGLWLVNELDKDPLSDYDYEMIKVVAR